MRRRDFAAVLVAYAAARIASNRSVGNGGGRIPRASVELSFYAEYSSHHSRRRAHGSSEVEEEDVDMSRPLAVDLDGDGEVDSLLVAYPPQQRHEEGVAEEELGRGDGGFRLLDLSSRSAEAGAASPAGPVFPRIMAEYKYEKPKEWVSMDERLRKAQQDNKQVNSMLANAVEAHRHSPVVVHLATGYEDARRKTKESLRIVAVWDDGSITYHRPTDLKLLWKTERAFVTSYGRKDPYSTTVSGKLCARLHFRDVAVLIVPPHSLHHNNTKDPSSAFQGAVVVAANIRCMAHHHQNPSDDELHHRFTYQAIRADTGQQIIWSHHRDSRSMAQGQKPQAHALHPTSPRAFGALRQHSKFLADEQVTESCFRHFAASVMDHRNQVFPHYWNGREDTKLSLAHFDRRKKHNKPQQQKTSSKQTLVTKPTQPKGKGKKGTSSHAHHSHPNVLVLHHETGVDVLSVRNGHPICHVSTVAGRYYDDVNGDGIVDQVRIVADGNTVSQGDATPDHAPGRGHGEEDVEWVQDLLRSSNLTTNSNNNNNMNNNNNNQEQVPYFRIPPCHVVALSGMPPTKRLFHGPLCHDQGKGATTIETEWGVVEANPKDHEVDFFHAASVDGAERRVWSEHPQLTVLQAARPLALVRHYSPHHHHHSHHHRRGPTRKDLVFAVNAGVVSRYDSMTGELRWQTKVGMPKWSVGREAGDHVAAVGSPAIVGRINVYQKQKKKKKKRQQNTGVTTSDASSSPPPPSQLAMHPMDRPIVVTGESGLVLLAPQTGIKLATIGGPTATSASFPQTPALSKPILTDFNHDGVTDIIVVTTDAVWGYAVAIEPRTSVLWMLLGLVYALLLVALVVKRFSAGRTVGGQALDHRSTDM